MIKGASADHNLNGPPLLERGGLLPPTLGGVDQHDLAENIRQPGQVRVLEDAGALAHVDVGVEEEGQRVRLGAAGGGDAGPAGRRGRPLAPLVPHVLAVGGKGVSKGVGRDKAEHSARFERGRVDNGRFRTIGMVDTNGKQRTLPRELRAHEVWSERILAVQLPRARARKGAARGATMGRVGGQVGIRRG